jgi:hypothetical protein
MRRASLNSHTLQELDFDLKSLICRCLVSWLLALSWEKSLGQLSRFAWDSEVLASHVTNLLLELSERLVEIFGFAEVGNLEDCNESFEPHCKADAHRKLTIKSEARGSWIFGEQALVRVTTKVLFDEQ